MTPIPLAAVASSLRDQLDNFMDEYRVDLYYYGDVGDDVRWLADHLNSALGALDETLEAAS